MQGEGMNEDDDYWGIIKFDDDEEEKLNVYSYLWLSEKLFLQGMCAFSTYSFPFVTCF